MDQRKFEAHGTPNQAPAAGPANSGRRRGQDTKLAVYFDGGCPLCAREIAWYRRQRGAEALAWIDISTVAGTWVVPGLRLDDAMARLHVRLPGGELRSGGQAFAELWTALPRLRAAGWLFRKQPFAVLLEALYSRFLVLRPRLQRRLASRCRRDCPYPRWLTRELRSDHAGETGAVFIYRGILSTTRSDELRAFANRHLGTEEQHLGRFETLLPPRYRSRLLPLWRLAGYLAGAVPALLGRAAVFVTIDAVETFVDRHYQGQIEDLHGQPEWLELRAFLEECRRDEVSHRNEARLARSASHGVLADAWTWLIGGGSAVAVSIARRI